MKIVDKRAPIVVVVFLFNVPPTAKVIWRREAHVVRGFGEQLIGPIQLHVKM